MQYNDDTLLDVAVVGGGPAGMQAALVFARSRKAVVVFDERKPPRNSDSRGMHNVFGMDGLLPTEIRDIAWRQVENYGGVELRQAEVLRIERTEQGFCLHTPDGRRTRARKVIAAFGYRDVLPDIPGFGACWSSTVIPCPFCDGFENKGGRWGVVPVDSIDAEVFPALAKNWSDETVVLLMDSVSVPADYEKQLEEMSIELVRGRVTRIDHDAGKLLAVMLDDGQRIALDTLLWKPPSKRVSLLEQMISDLDLETDESGRLVTDDNYETCVPGLFAVGDILGWAGAIGAAHAANVAASHIVRRWFR